MKIIPAIDIKNGNCVRLLQGDPDKETIYSNSPVDMAKHFESQGAELIHVVDLDGAFSGEPVNFDIVTAISKTVSIPIEIGGGIRTVETIKKYVDSGIERIILGTKILESTFIDSIKDYIQYIIAGVDAKNSKIATHGWKEVSSVDAFEFIQNVQSFGIKEVIYTDISTDGMMTGPNYSAIDHILEKCPGIKLIASGGISSIEDLQKLMPFVSKGVVGCIIGKAIYDGRIELDRAIQNII